MQRFAFSRAVADAKRAPGPRPMRTTTLRLKIEFVVDDLELVRVRSEVA